MEKTKNNQKAYLVEQVAAKHGVGTNYVYKVLNGERNNEHIFNDYMELREEIQQRLSIYQNTPLLNAVKDLVPFSR